MTALAALICAALYAGSAFYALLATHTVPPRAAAMQAALLLLGGAGGVFAWWRYQSNWFWLAGGVVLLLDFVLVVQAVRGRSLPPAVRAALGLIAAVVIARGILP